MANPELRDELLSKLMHKSLIEVPTTDFEDRVMLNIEARIANEKAMSGNAKISLFFLILGTVLGFIISYWLPIFGNTLLGVQMNTIVIIFQTLFIAVVLLQLENIIKLISRIKATSYRT